MRLCLPFAFGVLVGSVILPGQDPTPVDRRRRGRTYGCSFPSTGRNDTGAAGSRRR